MTETLIESEETISRVTISPAEIHDTAGKEQRVARELARLARDCLDLEVRTYPKPGLVSHVDNGSHRDMDAALLHRSAARLQPFFEKLARAGSANAEMDVLRKIGMDAEADMLAHTARVNTHRGAIFGLGLLVAAAGLRHSSRTTMSLGDIVAARWGADIIGGPMDTSSHGARVMQTYGVGGARGQAASGFADIYARGLGSLQEGLSLAQGDHHAARVHLCFSLIAGLDDTNLLHRGGRKGLIFAKRSALGFLDSGGVAACGWQARAEEIHKAFVGRNLSPGGAADLLAMTLFVHACDPVMPRLLAASEEEIAC